MFWLVSLSISVRVGECLGTCRKNLGACRDGFWLVLVCASMRVGDFLGRCRQSCTNGCTSINNGEILQQHTLVHEYASVKHKKPQRYW